MRKTLVSLAVLLAVGSANAAEVYSLDGVTINLNGEVGIQYIKERNENQHAEINVDEASFGFLMGYEMTEDLMIGASFGLDANNPEDNNRVTSGGASISLTMSQVHVVSFGDQSTIFDEAGIGDDYEFGFLAYVEELDREGEQVIKYKYNGQEVFSFGIAYSEHQNTAAGATDADGNAVTDDDYEVDAKLGIRLEDLFLELFVAHGEQNSFNTEAYVVEARYRLGDLLLAGSYGTSSAELPSGADQDIDMYGATATYFDGGRFKYGIGWATTDDSTEDDPVNTAYANITYIFTNEVNAYAEVGYTDNDNADTGYVIGMNAKF